MGLFANLKTAWKNRAALKAASNAADQIKEATVKSGWKTTEFWLVVVTNVIAVVQALNGTIPPEKTVTLMAALNGVYGVLRALTKATSLAQEAPRPPTP